MQERTSSIPPLPSECGGRTIGTRWRWVVLSPPTPRSPEWAKEDFRRRIGREPDRCYEEWIAGRQVFFMGWIASHEIPLWLGEEGEGGER